MKDTNSRNESIKIGLIVAAIILVGVVVVYGQPDGSSDPAKTDDSSRQTQPEETNPGDQTSGISKSEAEQIAIDKYGGTVKEIEGDDYKGIPAWEVEINDSKKGRIEVKVDKKTGDILDYEQD